MVNNAPVTFTFNGDAHPKADELTYDQLSALIAAGCDVVTVQRAMGYKSPPPPR